MKKNGKGGGFGGRRSSGRDFDRGGSRGFGGRDSGRPEMHQAVCSDCGKSCEVPFRPTEGKSVLCSDCFRGNERSSSRRPERDFKRRDFGEKTMFKAVCSDCGKSCEVPFRPTEGKGVLCSDCFGLKGGNTSRNAGRQDQDKFKEQFDNLNSKLDRILKIISPATSVSAVSVPVLDKKNTAKTDKIVKKEEKTNKISEKPAKKEPKAKVKTKKKK